MDAREKLQSMLKNMIVNQDDAAAEIDFHDFLVLKSREVTGFDIGGVEQDTQDVQDVD